MSNPRVFIVQQTLGKDRRTGLLKPVHDYSPAQDFGDIQVLLTPTANPKRPASILEDLWEKLADYGDDDYILCAGNPILIGWATAIAAGFNNGFVRMLQWNNRAGEYAAVDAQLWARRE